MVEINGLEQEEELNPKQNKKDKKKKQKKVYKINIDEIKHRYLSELLYLYYFEMIQKFPDSFKI